MEVRDKKMPNFNIKDFFTKENLPLILLICFAIYAVIAILVSVLVLKISVVVACAMVILEAGLAASLNRIPLWIHGLVFISHIVIGIIASQVPFMIFMTLVYVFAIVFLHIWSNNE